MSRYGLFNETRTTNTNALFFAIQAAFCSFPGDPLRKDLQEITGQISASTDPAVQSGLAAKGCSLAGDAVPLIQYCVWDYSLVPNVAKTEFLSWIDGIADNVREASQDGSDIGFETMDTCYFVVTLVLLSSHPTLKSWLEYLELKSPSEFFTRASIERLWKRFARPDGKIIQSAENALFAVTPAAGDRFYSCAQLRSDDWDYLRPVY